MYKTIMPDEYVTPDGIQRAIDAISRHPNHYENHDLEDELYRRVLKAIGEGQCSDPAECARLAITTQAFPFPRYTA